VEAGCRVCTDQREPTDAEELELEQRDELGAGISRRNLVMATGAALAAAASRNDGTSTR